MLIALVVENGKPGAGEVAQQLDYNTVVLEKDLSLVGSQHPHQVAHSYFLELQLLPGTTVARGCLASGPSHLHVQTYSQFKVTQTFKTFFKY